LVKVELDAVIYEAYQQIVDRHNKKKRKRSLSYNMGGVCDQCHLYTDSILHTIDYGSICNDCSLNVTRPYIAHAMKEIESQINGTKTEGDNSLAEEIDPELVDRLEELIARHKRQEEETKD
jgi:hypothetical protein